MKRRDFAESLPPLEVSSGESSCDEDKKAPARRPGAVDVVRSSSSSSPSNEDMKTSQQITQTALSNNLLARISEPTSDYRSSSATDAETQSCFSSLGRVSPSSSLRRELLRRSSLVADNSILDESLETECEVDSVGVPSRESVHSRIGSVALGRIDSNKKEESIARLKRQVQYKQVHRPAAIDTTADESSTLRVGRPNRVQLHIYDLIAKDTLVQFPSPLNCVCEIGKCFNDVNSALHELGTGAYQ